MGAFELRELSFTYPGQSQKALDSVTLTVERGDFFVLCGPSGCGKTTLLRQLKPALTPHGEQTGELLFDGRPLDKLDRRDQARRIGFVRQSPEDQIVTDKVWHELAFGLESLGCDTPTIRRRVAEMAAFFGIQGWFYKDVSTLSGGQKQLLNLAAVMVMQPDVLILDEPTGQLDPIAASDFLSTLGRINRDLGATVILTEHRLEDALPLATHAAVMDQGKLLCVGRPAQVGETLQKTDHAMFLSMPTPMRVWAAAGGEPPCPVTVREGRGWLDAFALAHPLRPLPPELTPPAAGETALECDELWFKYEKDQPDVVKDLSLTVKKGEFVALLGGNGAGKTTALKLLAGLLQPYRGRVTAHGSLAVLPQDPQALFVRKTVREDLWELLDSRGLAPSEIDQRLAQVTALCRLTGLLDRHPYDLSGGERQRLALAKILLPQPDILLLDEPTKGLDAQFKITLAGILRALLERGVSVVMVSHDVEFCAQYAHRCALFFDGSVAAQDAPRAFFSGNSFYTTSANRMARHRLPQAVTVADLAAACGAPPPAEPEPPQDLPPMPTPPTPENPAAAKPPDSPPKKRRKLPLRTRVSAALILLLVPLTLYAGVHYFGGKQYYLISLLMVLEIMLPFFLVFEGRKPQARELVVIAVLCAIGVAGRAAFAMLPQFKPILAITVIAGAALGGESGFLVGAMIMLASNIPQGPWTPWQMFAMGLTGFLAGVLCQTGLLRRSRGALCVFGALATVVIYGGFLNTASALRASGVFDLKIILAYELSGLPFDCVHAAATCVFLWLGARPFLEKLERVRTKYALPQ